MKNALVYTIVLSLGLAAGPTVWAKTLYKGDSDVCRTTYKNGRNPCVGIAGAGAAVGCVTAGAPTVTNNKGKSAVTVTWNSNGNGSYDWNNVGACVPNPLNCFYQCRTRRSTAASPEELEHAGAIAVYTDVMGSVFSASTADEVASAVDSSIAALLEVPLGQTYDANLQASAIGELQDLYGSESVINDDVPVSATAVPAMLSDFEQAWPESVDATPVE